MKYDVIVGNPPFQDKAKRNTTPHKIWIEFTHKVFDNLEDGGALLWVSPASWGSPSSKVLQYFWQYQVPNIDLDTAEHFPGIGSTFSNYLVYKQNDDTTATEFTKNGATFSAIIDDSVKYLGNDFCEHSFNIHKKVMFDTQDKLPISYDYVTCHNVIRHTFKLHEKRIANTKKALQNATSAKATIRAQERLSRLINERSRLSVTISEHQTTKHRYPILHTNNKTWYSSIKQDFLDKKKVMWSRSGYTKPFYDKGTKGCTDLGYYTTVASDTEGEILSHNLQTKLFRYIFATARWSGFGNDKVFKMLPDLKTAKALSDSEIFKKFNITQAEQAYIDKFLQPKKTKRKSKKNTTDSQTKSQNRIDNFGEVFTPQELVGQMLAALKDECWQPGIKFLDPACGTGNFLVAVVEKKIEAGLSAKEAIKTTYGVDIMEDNIIECRRRINKLTNYAHIDLVAEQITHGNFLNNE